MLRFLSTNAQDFMKDFYAKIYENHLNPVILVFIWKLLLSTIKWISMCQGFGHFSSFCQHATLTKLVIGSKRVKIVSSVDVLLSVQPVPQEITIWYWSYLFWFDYFIHFALAGCECRAHGDILSTLLHASRIIALAWSQKTFDVGDSMPI